MLFRIIMLNGTVFRTEESTPTDASVLKVLIFQYVINNIQIYCVVFYFVNININHHIARVFALAFYFVNN